MGRAGIPQCTLEQYEQEFSGRHLVHGVVAWWAARKPGEPALIHPARGKVTSWGAFDAASTQIAKRLLGTGFRKGDFLGTVLPFVAEHILLEYACFKIGVVLAPLDLRLRPAEIVAALAAIRAKGFAGPAEACELVRKECPFVASVLPLVPGAEFGGTAAP